MLDYKCALCGRARYGSTTGGQYVRQNGGNGLVNDGGDRCTDCLETPPAYPVGSTIGVHAWWLNGKPVKCEVVACRENFLEVAPVEGNPHHRYINAKDVIDMTSRQEQKTFYVEGFGVVAAVNLAGFAPQPRNKQLAELGVNESSTGSLDKGRELTPPGGDKIRVTRTA